MKDYNFIPAKAVIALIMNALILAWIVSELTGRTTYADLALILVAIAGFAGSVAAVVLEIKRVKRRGKCTFAVRAKCTGVLERTGVQEHPDISESNGEPTEYSLKWKYSFFGREYEVQDEVHAGGNRRLPQIGSVKDMFVNPDDPNEFFYDTKPRGISVLIGVISGAALTVSVSILILT